VSPEEEAVEMKLHGMFFLLAVALAIGLWTASSALAQEFKPTVLCKSNPESGNCEESNVIHDGTAIHAKAANVTLTTGGMTVTCAESTFEGKTKESKETLELNAEVSKLTFSGCTGPLKTSCTVTAHSLAFNAAFAIGEKHGEGRLALWEGAGKGVPAAEVKCAALGFDCEYKAAEELKLESAGATVKAVQLQAHGGSPATTTAKEDRLTASTPKEGNCLGSTEGHLSGEWSVSEPNPLFVEQAIFAATIVPSPVIIEKVGDTVTVEIENNGKRAWSIGVVGKMGKFNIVEVEGSSCLSRVLKPEEKCREGLECTGKTVGEFFVGADIPEVDVLEVTRAEVKCE
jgi:hypothetical protein